MRLHRLHRVDRLLLVVAGRYRRSLVAVVGVWRRMFRLGGVVVLCRPLVWGRCRRRLSLRLPSARRRSRVAGVRGLRWWPAAGVPVLVRR